jgi:nuclear GTP-binding protein
VLRDWNTGKFAHYTLPPIDGGTVVSPPTDVDEKILNHTRTRKELRKHGGLVKMLISAVDRREVDLETPWEDEQESDEEDDEMVGQMMDVDEKESGEESVSDDEEEASQDEDEESDGQEEASKVEDRSPPNTLTQKRKRAVSFASAPPVKKVTFAFRKQKQPAQTSVEVPQEEQDPKLNRKKSTTAMKPRHMKTAPGKIANTNIARPSKKKTDGPEDVNAYDFTKFF